MLNLNDFAKEVHRVAVEHGWYDGQETRSTDEIIALIHSEWSEALEEYRAGRPMLWHECMNCHEPCMEDGCGDWYDGECALGELAKKPEGIMIELIDGCIRILDFIGYKRWTIPEIFDTIDKLMECAKLLHDEWLYVQSKDMILPALVRWLHWYTAEYEMTKDTYDPTTLLAAVGIAFLWIKTHGGEPEDLLRMKHEYNKARPYKHGGKRC